jgi:hypothetical protein
LATQRAGYALPEIQREEVFSAMRTATATQTPRAGASWLFLIYLVAGGIVAATHHYWSNLHTLKAVISALLATVLWPLILIGVNLHIH